MLDGRRATTHWRHAATLARRYPRISVEPDVIHIRDGRFLTSAGISAGIDLALALVEEDAGAEAARAVAQGLVMFLQRPAGQSPFSAALSGPMPRESCLRGRMESVQADPAVEHTVSGMAAQRSGFGSDETLRRAFARQPGTTPRVFRERFAATAPPARRALD